MIIATIPHAGTPLQVEVTGAHDRVAEVQTLDGSAPFLRWTHGGWAYYCEAQVPIRLLKDVTITPDNFPTLSETDLKLKGTYENEHQQFFPIQIPQVR